MLDEELREYIIELLDQGYDIYEIQDMLIEKGHDIEHVEDITLRVFEFFHKDLLTLISNETKKGRSIEDVRKALIEAGHSEDKIRAIIHHHHIKNVRTNKFLKESWTCCRKILALPLWQILCIMLIFNYIAFF